MLNYILSSVVKDYKKDLAKVAVSFVGGVAVGFILSKTINEKNITNFKNEANNFVSSINSQDNEILDSDEKEEILDLKNDKESIEVNIELEENDE